jgi:hypothetical protein
MIRLAPAVLVLILAAVPALAQDRGNTRLLDFTTVDGRFKARMPRGADSDTKELATGPGGIQAVPVTTVRATGPDRAVYAVTYADYPESFRSVAAKALLDGVRDGLKGTDGKVVQDEETTARAGTETITGRAFRIEAGSNVVRARVFLVENRLYQVMVTGKKSAVDRATADEFLKSFELLR